MSGCICQDEHRRGYCREPGCPYNLGAWPTTDWPTICPSCGAKHEAITNVEARDVLPDNGDVSICFRCGEICIFDDKAYGGMRKPTKKEQREIARDKESDRSAGRLEDRKAAMKRGRPVHHQPNGPTLS